MAERSDAHPHLTLTDGSRPNTWRAAVLLGVAAVIIFAAMAVYRLERPGVYYDELHQATGAFAYVGRPTTMFSFVPIRGVPLLNMTYTGAIKTAVYGLYLRVSGRPFSIWSWRLLGIIFSAAGVFLFCVLTGGRLPLAALAVFLALLISDVNVLLQSRHDWGPAALALLLRMVFLALAIRHLTGTHRWAPFVLGLVVGVAIFEKLSSTVLLGPLAIVLMADARTRSARALAQAAIGIVVGALPAIAVNLHSLVTTSRLLAFTALDTTPRRSIVGYAANFLVLGNGGMERRMILDASSLPWTEYLEGLAIVSVLALVGFEAWRRWRFDDGARLAGVALMCYLAVGLTLPFLPHGTAEHHWIIGTPFQYLAIVLATASLWSRPFPSLVARRLLVAGLALLAAARAPAMATTFVAMRADQYSRAWDPSLNTAAAFAAAQPASAIFIAANWGIGAQVFCFANGRQNFVFELFWEYGGPETLNPVLDPPERQLVIVAAVKPTVPPPAPGLINPQWQVTEAIFSDLFASPQWEEVPVDPSIRALRAVEVRAFRRRSRVGAL